MSMTDPVADMLTRIRNAQVARKVSVSVPASKLKLAIARVLEAEGYVQSVSEDAGSGKPALNIELKYHEDAPVIERIQRVSRPGLAGLQERGRSAQGSGRARRCDRLHVEGGRYGSPGAGRGAGRRSPLRGLLKIMSRTMSRVAKRPLLAVKGVTTDVKDDVGHGEGAEGHLVAHAQFGDRVEQARSDTVSRRQVGQPLRARDGGHDARVAQQHGHAASARGSSASSSSWASVTALRHRARRSI